MAAKQLLVALFAKQHIFSKHCHSLFLSQACSKGNVQMICGWTHFLTSFDHYPQLFNKPSYAFHVEVV